VRRHNPHHTKRFKRDSPVIKFYEKVWGFDPAGANFCKLFWACFIFAPVGVLYWLGLHGLSALGTKASHALDWVEAHIPTPEEPPLTSEELKIAAAKRAYKDAKRAYRLLKRERRARIWRERAEHVQERFANGADRVAAFFQHPVPNFLAKAALVAVPVGVLILFFVTDFWKTLLVLGGGVVTVAFFIGVIALLESGILGGPARRVGNGITGAGNFVADGIIAIKDRTCPGIEVEGLNEREQTVRA
jgi:hypothetical protein